VEGLVLRAMDNATKYELSERKVLGKDGLYTLLLDAPDDLPSGEDFDVLVLVEGPGGALAQFVVKVMVGESTKYFYAGSDVSSPEAAGCVEGAQGWDGGPAPVKGIIFSRIDA
jgi:hypothetical protein